MILYIMKVLFTYRTKVGNRNRMSASMNAQIEYKGQRNASAKDKGLRTQKNGRFAPEQN